MILAIYGTTHSGKTSLATMIEQTSRESVSTIHTDAILALHSLHDPWNGHDDEVAPWHAREFHNLVLDEVMIASKDSHVVIVEGNALSPLVTSSWLHPDTQILLCRRSVSPLRMLRECRVTDRGRYTSAKDDEYLLTYFCTQQTLACKWASAFDGRDGISVIDTTDMHDGLVEACHVAQDAIARYGDSL